MAEIQVGEWRGLLNAGGVRRLRLVRLPHVVALYGPTVGVELEPGGLVLSDTAQIVDIRFGENGCSYQLGESEGEAGSSYDVQLTLDIPKQRADVLGFFRDNERYRWLAFVESRNNDTFLLGDPESDGLSRLLTTQTGSKGADRNSQRITLQGAMWHPAWFITRMDWAEFSSEFSTEFFL